MARVQHAKDVAAERLLSIPGVHTVGIGYKRRGGEVTADLAVIVFVDTKLPRADVPPDRMVPLEIRFFMDSSDREESVPTDVVEQARPVEYTHIPAGTLAGRARPVAGGRSIARAASGGGTLGGWVWDGLNDEVVLLTNNHVLGGAAGTDVFQPWGSTAATDHIADVVRTGTLDATIAAPVNAADVLEEIEGVGPAVFEITTATVGMPVEKSGAKTDHTTGWVEYVGLTGHYGSTNDFQVAPDPGMPNGRFAYYGDSGSLIVERTNPSGGSWKRVVGLLWGGNPELGNAKAHQVQDVFADLNLDTLCAGAFEEFLDNLFAPNFPEEPLKVTPIQLPEPVTMPLTTGPRVSLSGALLALQQAAGRPFARSRPLHRGMARDVEARLRLSRMGSDLVTAIHENRVGLARLVLDRQTRRALASAAAPFVEGVWTADELLGRQVTEEDLARFHRVARIAEDHRPELQPLLERVNRILGELPGRSFDDVLR
ncbi:hypothetical protein N865_01135 [Intrasporangium oryzae NRRL B-24470]|uniref:Serine protease n=2 Tax=Intrasporangium TaxID=53357 RepID=W9G4A1_9MICO|nr:hypothetical protein N865_01135 [Intrasporangium oryzae NRRL B-24470]